MIKRIEQVLEEKVRPALLSHEGDVQIVEYVLVNEVSPELLDFARKLLNHDHGAQDGLC